VRAKAQQGLEEVAATDLGFLGAPASCCTRTGRGPDQRKVLATSFLGVPRSTVASTRNLRSFE
jgi:hypothetical protein